MRITSVPNNVPTLHAYLNTPLPPPSVAQIYTDFHLGSHSPGGQQVRLSIHDEPRFYNATAEEILTTLDSEGAGLEEFLLVEKGTEATGAVWYVSGWKEDDEPEPVLWKLPIMVKAVPSRWIDYSIGNSSIEEDLDQIPSSADDSYSLQAPYTADIDGPAFIPPAYLVAEPGEFEEGPGSNLDVDPPQEKVYRLKEDVATQFGLRSGWAVGWQARPEDNAPEGSVCFAQEYL